MIFKKYYFILFFFILSSCSQLEFTYNEKKNLTNPIYNKTTVTISGKEIPPIQRYISSYLGKGKENNYSLQIIIIEETIKRSVQSNQAISKMDYSLEFQYTLKRSLEDCVLYKKNIFSNFSYVPKSEGYNFGSDESLDKMYELAARENIAEFIRFVSNNSLASCINEG